ncbi:MAG TPA: sulfotransferase family 2 domain-containing protein [Nevskiaceae bacterium]|nr:sulfotransferase family 2 domain-containing protein [Nevskiaceae bacterium]
MPGGIVSLPSLPVIYLNIPKSACTSVKNHLFFLHHGHYLDNPLDIHKALQKSREADVQERKAVRRRLATRSMSFTFVRHPGKRAYSCFGEKICTDSPYAFPRIREFLVGNYGVDFDGYGTPAYSLERHRENYGRFLEFVRDNVAHKTSVRRDAHWAPQVELLHHFQRALIIDFIGRVETFAEDLRFALRGVPAAASIDWSRKFNEGPPPPFSYEEVATPELRDLMHQVYRRDYERLAYTR